MVIFKVLLIILIALPVIALASYFYSQMLSYIKAKTRLRMKRSDRALLNRKPLKTTERALERAKRRRRRSRNEGFVYYP